MASADLLDQHILFLKSSGRSKISLSFLFHYKKNPTHLSCLFPEERTTLTPEEGGCKEEKTALTATHVSVEATMTIIIPSPHLVQPRQGLGVVLGPDRAHRDGVLSKGKRPKRLTERSPEGRNICQGNSLTGPVVGVISRQGRSFPPRFPPPRLPVKAATPQRLRGCKAGVTFIAKHRQPGGQTQDDRNLNMLQDVRRDKSQSEKGSHQPLCCSGVGPVPHLLCSCSSAGEGWFSFGSNAWKSLRPSRRYQEPSKPPPQVENMQSLFLTDVRLHL